jgi:outer membrane biosynthesis protein TonB
MKSVAAVGRAAVLLGALFLLVNCKAQVDGSTGPQATAGTIDKAAVEGVLASHAADVRGCYRARLQANDKLAGALKLAFMLGTDGKVVKVAVADNATGDEELAGCVTRALQGWAFPAPQGGEAEFGCAFTFARGELALGSSPAEVLAGGKLDPKATTKALNKAQKAVGKCLKAVPKKALRKLSGKVKLAVAVGEDGKATATVKKNGAGNAELAQCLADAVAAVKFPKPEGGAASLIRSYSFKKGKPGKAKLAIAKAPGKVDPKEVNALFEAQAPELQACYAARASAGAAPAGELKLRVTSDKEGKVTAAVVEGNTTNDAELGSCLASHVKAWAFPKAEGGDAVALKGFTFARGEDKVEGQLGDQVMPGVLKSEAVTATFDLHVEEVRACYEEALKANGKLKGESRFKLLIGAEGKVKELSVLSDTTQDEGLLGCVTGRVKAWDFDKPQGGDVAFVRTIVFGKK